MPADAKNVDVVECLQRLSQDSIVTLVWVVSTDPSMRSAGRGKEYRCNLKP